MTGRHGYGVSGSSPRREIPGEESTTIGVRFEHMSNGEIHVAELLPGTPASNSLHRPHLGDQLFRVNGKLLPALIDQRKLTLLLAQQCYESDTISLSFRTDSLDEYTSVIHLNNDTSASPHRATNSNSYNTTNDDSVNHSSITPPSLSRSPEKSISFSDPLTRSPSPERERPAYLPIGLSSSDPRWAQLSSPVDMKNDELPPKSSLTEFLNEMRLELGRVRTLAQQKVDDAERRRVEAEEDLDALQEQTFSRVQHMQEQITALRTENQSLRAEVQQLNRTVRTRNMPICPSCNRLNMHDLQEGAAAAIEKARSLLQDTRTSDTAPSLPRLPLNSSPAGQYYIETASVPPGAVGWQGPGSQGGGEGRPGNKGTDGRGSQNHVSIAWEDLKRMPRGGQRASVMMEDGSELSVDPQTGRVFNNGEHGGLELL